MTPNETTDAKAKAIEETMPSDAGKSTVNPRVRPPLEHELKTHPKYFMAMWRGEKPFEVRKNDRDFQVGDTLRLRYYDPVADQYSGHEMVKKVLCVLRGPCFGIERGYCVMGVA